MSRVLPILFQTDMVRAILDGRKTVTRRCVKPKCKGGEILDEKPPYQPGDILYVRETWTLEEFYDNEALIKFRAGGEKALEYETEGDTYHKLLKFTDDKWIPSLFMPKEAARIWLKVTEVRVERLKNITEKEAEKEGFIDDVEYSKGKTARAHFMQLWDTTIKKSDIATYGWDSNPYVWVIEFERCEKPEGE